MPATKCQIYFYAIFNINITYFYFQLPYLTHPSYCYYPHSLAQDGELIFGFFSVPFPTSTTYFNDPGTQRGLKAIQTCSCHKWKTVLVGLRFPHHFLYLLPLNTFLYLLSLATWPWRLIKADIPIQASDTYPYTHPLPGYWLEKHHQMSTCPTLWLETAWEPGPTQFLYHGWSSKPVERPSLPILHDIESLKFGDMWCNWWGQSERPHWVRGSLAS